MPLALSALPIATDYDPAADPPGSVDPLGTMAAAADLADLLLPGMTARMYRPRLLTVSAVGALVADRVVRARAGREQLRHDARLAFERMYLFSLVRLHHQEGKIGIVRRVAGRRRARQAFESEEPLTSTNFLKGQSVNGPAGVMARLAEDLGILDDDGNVISRGSELLAAWSRDEGLVGVLADDAAAEEDGSVWLKRVAQAAVAWLERREWPSSKSRVWADLAAHLRPDVMRSRERRCLSTLLDANPTRHRVLNLFRSPRAVNIYRKRLNEDRGQAERDVLLNGVRPALGRDSRDQFIRAVIDAIEAYEYVSTVLQEGFDSLRWVLTRESGAVRIDRILSHPACGRALSRSLRQVKRSAPALVQAMTALTSVNPGAADGVLDAMARMRYDVETSLKSERDLVETLLARHEGVQRQKQKGVWIHRGEVWVLMPGFGMRMMDVPGVERVQAEPVGFVSEGDVVG